MAESKEHVVRVKVKVDDKDLQKSVKNIDKNTKGLRRFHGELLSVMFAGMALQRQLQAVTDASMELTGTTDILNAAAQILAVEGFDPLTTFYNDLGLAILDADEGTQAFLGSLAGIGRLAGQVAVWIGQIGLVLFALKQLGVNISLSPIFQSLASAAQSAFAVITTQFSKMMNFIDMLVRKPYELIIQLKDMVTPVLDKIWALLVPFGQRILNLFNSIFGPFMNLIGGGALPFGLPLAIIPPGFSPISGPITSTSVPSSGQVFASAPSTYTPSPKQAEPIIQNNYYNGYTTDDLKRVVSESNDKLVSSVRQSKFS
jgi:hypothetical protein